MQPRWHFHLQQASLQSELELGAVADFAALAGAAVPEIGNLAGVAADIHHTAGCSPADIVLDRRYTGHRTVDILAGLRIEGIHTAAAAVAVAAAAAAGYSTDCTVVHTRRHTVGIALREQKIVPRG